METKEEITFSRNSLDILERGDWVQADTQGQAVRFAVARAAFLDCLLRDAEVVGQVVDRFDEITGASDIVDQIWTHMDARPGDSHWTNGEKTEFLTRQRELTQDLFAVVTGEDENQSRALIAAASGWVRQRGFDWPWLVHDLVLWYRDKVLHLSPTGGWFGTLQKPLAEWTFTPIVEPEWPSMELRHRNGETIDSYRERAKASLSSFLSDLDSEWPRGRVPTDATTIERNVQWFYRIVAKHQTKSAITEEAFAELYDHASPDERSRLLDGRRKDVREGVRQAKELLDSSGLRFED